MPSFKVHYEVVKDLMRDAMTVDAPNPDAAGKMVRERLFPTKIAITKVKLNREQVA